jgi:hypothetical protein
MIIRYDIHDAPPAAQELAHIHITESEIVELATAFQKIGFWRAEVGSGHFYWSRGIFDIYGMEYSADPIDVSAANAQMHPEDIEPLYSMLEVACAEKTAFHSILRLKRPTGDYGFVRCVGKYRERDGRGELIGMFYAFFEPLRTVALARTCDENQATSKT